MQLNKTTYTLTPIEFSNLETILKKVASENNISDVSEVQLTITAQDAVIKFKQAFWGTVAKIAIPIIVDFLVGRLVGSEEKDVGSALAQAPEHIQQQYQDLVNEAGEEEANKLLQEAMQSKLSLQG